MLRIHFGHRSVFFFCALLIVQASTPGALVRLDPKEIALLSRVEVVMREAEQLLSRPDTGPEPIAAETEAIELLLQTKRINPKGGGGGGASPGGGGTGTTDESALALLGAGDERNAQANDREVSQSTGVSGSAFPAEFRAGLDTYFGKLEGDRPN